MRARWLKLAYGLRYHRLGSWALDGWLSALLALAAGYLVLSDRLRPPALAWGAAGVLAILAAAVPFLIARAAERSFVVFAPDASSSMPAPQPSDPSDKVLLHATGQFEVEGKSHFFADLPAYWRTFATREHAIMAIVGRARFLLLGTMPARDTGMWYIFFRPETVQAVEAGRIAFGRACRPALHVGYLRPPVVGAKRRWLGLRPPPGAGPADVYLGFDDEGTRQAVWADLLAGATEGNR